MEEKNIKKEINELRKGICEAQDPNSYCFELGTKLLDGFLGAEGEVYAAEFLRYAAERDDRDAMFNLAMCYRWGNGGVYADPDEAILWFKKAAEKGHETANRCYESFHTDQGKYILLMSAISGVKGSGSKWYKAKFSVDHYYKLAESGNEEAQYELARQLENPERLGAFKHNIEEAIHWYTEAANNGVVDAMFNLAVIYYKGKLGIPVDKNKAKYWFERAAEKGDTEAKQMVNKIALETE